MDGALGFAQAATLEEGDSAARCQEGKDAWLRAGEGCQMRVLHPASPQAMGIFGNRLPITPEIVSKNLMAATEIHHLRHAKWRAPRSKAPFECFSKWWTAFCLVSTVQGSSKEFQPFYYCTTILRSPDAGMQNRPIDPNAISVWHKREPLTCCRWSRPDLLRGVLWPLPC